MTKLEKLKSTKQLAKELRKIKKAVRSGKISYSDGWFLAAPLLNEINIKRLFLTLRYAVYCEACHNLKFDEYMKW